MSEIKLQADSGGGTVALKGPATTTSNANVQFVLPVADGTAGEVLSTDASGNLSFVGNTPAWFAKQTSVQNISNDTQTEVTGLTSDQITVGGGWDGTNGTFTVPSGGAGVYYVFGAAGIDDINSNRRIHTKFKKNSDQSTWYGSIHSHGNDNDIMMAQITGMYSLAVGDTLKITVWHNEGSTQETEASRCWFGGYRLIGA